MTEQKQTLEEMTLRQLRKIASILNIPRYSRMRKQQLLNIIKTKKMIFPLKTPTHLTMWIIRQKKVVK